MTKPELVVESHCKIAECPRWDETRQALFWCDIPTGTLYEYRPSTSESHTFQTGRRLGGFVFDDRGGLFLFQEGGQVSRWTPDATEILLDSLLDTEEDCFNDVRVGPDSRVYCGTVPTDSHAGRLYRFCESSELTHLIEDLDLPNGLDFSPSSDTFYLAESRAQRIHAFDFSIEDGAISNRRTFVQTTNEAGKPDGLTVDSDGSVWVALWGSGSVVKYSPEGDELSRYDLPVDRVSSPAFGGPDLSDLYVTTAHAGAADADSRSGGIFRFNDVGPGTKEARISID